MIIEQILNKGFAIELNERGGFTVTPADKLTNQQCKFLTANKPQIMRELLLTTVYNLYGVPMQIQAKDAQHKKWLIAVNHKSTTPVEFNYDDE